MKLEMLLCAKSRRTDGRTDGRDGFPARNFYGFTPPPPARREMRERERQKMPTAA